MKPINQTQASYNRCRSSLQQSTHPKPGETLARRLPSALVAIGLALCGAFSIQAQTPWTIVDDVVDGSARGVVSDSAGNIYVSGNIGKRQQDGSTAYHAVVLKSSNQGATWDNDPSTPDTEEPSYYSPAEAGSASFSAIAVMTTQIEPGLFQDQLVAAGSFQGNWIVYRSVNAGASWSPISEAFSSGYDSQFLGSVAFDAVGNIYLAGNAERRTTTKKGTTTVYHWLIRKGSKGVDGSYSWSTVGDFSFSTGGRAYGVACVGTDVFVAGNADSFWEVRKSSNGGVSWDVVDHFQMEPGYGAAAKGMTADNFGNLFVVGMASRNGARNGTDLFWVVRKGTRIGAGHSFKSIDSFLPGGNAQPLGVAVAPDRSVHVVGMAQGGSGLVKWYTRQGTEGAAGSWSWSTDVFNFANNKFASGYGITVDLIGNVFAVGHADHPDGTEHRWLVRRKLASAP